MSGLLITAEGIDASGKGVIVDAWEEFLKENVDYSIADIHNYYNFYPKFDEEAPQKAYVICEPTCWGIGKTITEELISKERQYPTRVTAHAYSMDRLVFYNLFVLPALRAGKILLQDRCVASSIAYQPLQAELRSEELDLDYVLRLDGNKLALTRVPDLLAISKVPADVAVERLESREKQDNSIFDTEEFQSRLLIRYSSPWFKKIFTSRGSKVVDIDTSGSVEETRTQATEILEEFLKEKGIIA